MTNEERDIISQFIARFGGAAAGNAGFSPQGAPAQPLPPIDPEADNLIGELFTRYPEARYRLTQTAYVQDKAMAQATARIQQLEAALAQAQQAAQAAPRSGGFLSSIFGGAPRQPAPPTSPAWNQGAQPGYAPQQPSYAPPPQMQAPQQGGMLGGGGGGFLGSALTTAAGVAGGIVAANALTSLFTGHHGGGFGGPEGMLPTATDSNPWATSPPAQDAGYVDQGSWSNDAGQPQPDQVVQQDNGWSDAGGGDAGGGGGGDDNWS